MNLWRGMLAAGKPKNAGAVITRLLAYIGNVKPKVLFVLICVLASTFTNLGSNYILRPVINNLIDTNRTTEDKISSLLLGIMTMAGIYFISFPDILFFEFSYREVS